MTTKIPYIINPDGSMGETWNVVHGCTPIGPGCQNCYAERMAIRMAGRHGYPEDDPFAVTLRPDRLDEPLRWRKRRTVMVCSMGDLFHSAVPDHFILRVFRRMMETQEHTYLLFTKRPDRMLDIWQRLSFTHDDKLRLKAWRQPWHDQLSTAHTRNIVPCISAENQFWLGRRLPFLMAIKAEVLAVSLEPLLGRIDFMGVDSQTPWPLTPLEGGILRGYSHDPINYAPLGWVIAGGEAGAGARAPQLEWFRRIRDDCVDNGIPFYFKSWGGPHYNGWIDEQNHTYYHRDTLDGRQWHQLPWEVQYG